MSEERLESIERQIAELTLLTVQQGRTRNVNDPSPTPSTLGRKAVADLMQYGGYCVVGGEEYLRRFPGAQEPPFLNETQIQELRDAHFGDDESKLTQFFQPFFRELMTNTSKELGFKVVLLNSERHPWVKCPRGGADTIPDGVGLAVEFAHFSVGDKDKEYQNGADYHFGKVANWVLRDSIEFITEWNTGKTFVRGYGEGIEYHLRIRASFDQDRQVLESKQTTDCLVANEQGFYLTRCVNGSPRSLYVSDWDSPYSMDALHRFTLGTLWPSAPRERIWKLALISAYQTLRVKPLAPSIGPNCFLGYGSDGRVFRVENENGMTLALKICVGDLSRATSEIKGMRLHKDELERTGATVRLVKHAVRRAENYAALLIGPVGRTLRPLKKDVCAALDSLRALHVAGFVHGDARWKNAIILSDDTCRWIDLRTLEDIDSESEEFKIKEFHNDVVTFVESFGTRFDLSRSLTSAYLQSNDVTELLKAVVPIWRKPNSSEANAA
mmetsp:Transcript_12517/g.34747  ORF Transcript_12517/g.34747 Transcript_12517/m.34747 type:complete len:498 (+) Transcript_12517:233-1726(+)|eukprot:CAMPEP_0168748558 /NCGR_PEP_ID=MMETSP0724-20121128/16241_1 /TAXON_ID=265536 /ORGANISM="Amphiprora sp., Strain CCMP467" /LENGTH=497 /DNA_ID=CAMNT_0008796397 /DNA_START=174 /DNA_END=1667 /DNA_ORIENTATION=+